MIADGNALGAIDAAAAAAETKRFLRVEGDREEALLARLAGSAAALCEAFTGQVLVARTMSETLAASPRWTRLARTPVRAISGVEAIDADGTSTALPASAYAVDIDAGGDGWVRCLDAAGKKRIRVLFEAGLADDWEGLPEAPRQGIVRLAAHLFSDRGGGGETGLPAAVTALWRPWRRIGFGTVGERAG